MSNTVDITNADTSNLKFSVPQDVDGYTRSGVGYGDHEPVLTRDDGKRLLDDDYLYFTTPQMHCYGVFPTYEYQKPRTEDNINGYQVIVPLTSDETVEKPTKQEKQILDFFSGLKQQLCDFMIEHQDDLPEHYQAVSADKMGMMVNSIVSRPKKKDDEEGGVASKNAKNKKREEDQSKPQTLYLPLIFYKHNAKFGTNVHGPGDRSVDPLKYHKVPGKIEMVIRVRYVNYGKKATFNMQLYECNYIPEQRVPRRRMLGGNDAPADADIEPPTQVPRPKPQAKNLKAKDNYNPDEDVVTGPSQGDSEPQYEIVTRADGKKVRRKVKN